MVGLQKKRMSKGCSRRLASSATPSDGEFTTGAWLGRLTLLLRERRPCVVVAVAVAVVVVVVVVVVEGESGRVTAH
jgi:hypothetical protein